MTEVNVNAILLNKAFRAYAKGSGSHSYLPLRHLRSALQNMALYPSEVTIFELVQKFHKEGPDGKMPPGLSFEMFAALVAAQRCGEDSKPASDSAVDEAYFALGGSRDKQSDIRTDLLRHVIRDEFALPIEIDRLIAEIDLDSGGTLSYDEVATFLRQTNRPWLPPGSKPTGLSKKK